MAERPTMCLRMGQTYMWKQRKLQCLFLRTKKVRHWRSTKEPWSVFKGVRHQKYFAHLIITFSTVDMISCWVLEIFPSIMIIITNSKKDIAILWYKLKSGNI